MAHKFFISGTGTDVGKTYISAGIAKQFCMQSSLPFQYIKPFASGVSDINTDVDEVAHAIKTLKNGKAEGWCCYLEPASPYIAAKNENKIVEYDETLNKLKHLSLASNLNMLVEGAGGVMVPISENKNVIDLIEALKLPVVIVGHLGLGTVNHTCLTIEALQRRDCKIAGFVLNQTKPIGELSLAEKTNADEIMRLTKINHLGTVPFNCGFDHLVFQKIAKQLLAI